MVEAKVIRFFCLTESVSKSEIFSPIMFFCAITFGRDLSGNMYSRYSPFVVDTKGILHDLLFD